MSVLDEILLRVANRDRTETESKDLMMPAVFDKSSIDKYGKMQRGLADSLLLQCSQVNKDIRLLDRTIFAMAKKILELSDGKTDLAAVTSLKEHYINEELEKTAMHLRPLPEPEPEPEEPKGKKAGPVVKKPLEVEGQKTIFDQDAKADKPAGAVATTSASAETNASIKKQPKKEVA